MLFIEMTEVSVVITVAYINLHKLTAVNLGKLLSTVEKNVCIKINGILWSLQRLENSQAV